MSHVTRRSFLERIVLATGALTVGSRLLPAAEPVGGSDRVKPAIEPYGATLTPATTHGGVVVPAVKPPLEVNYA
ncbi:MAG: hypothetical protein ACYSWQ_00050 [Planctomycetota bacterium]|jgi:hypothetical protein